jgi:hypothetical protein
MAIGTQPEKAMDTNKAKTQMIFFILTLLHSDANLDILSIWLTPYDDIEIQKTDNNNL